VLISLPLRYRAAVAILLTLGMAWLATTPGRAAQAAAPRAVSLVITNGIIVTVDGQRRVLNPGAVAVDGTDIVAIDTPDAIAARFTGAETIDAAGQVVMPGLINTHTHAPMVLYRGLADDLKLMDWLQKFIFPAEAKTVSPEFVRTGTRLAALEMIQSGTTAYADMYYFEEEIAKATADAGLRGVLGQTIIKFPVADAQSPAEALVRAQRFIVAWKNHPLITPAVAPHAPYTLEGDTLKQCFALAKDQGVPMIIHLAETRDEVFQIRDQYRLSPTAFLNSLGVLGPNVLAAHGVWVVKEDIALLKQHGVAVSHNPESNMKLASGAAPVVDMLNAGITVGLGTDGAASNNDLDMFEAMRQASFLQKLRYNDPTVAPAATVLDMATRQGAQALGLGKITGALEVGKRADVIIVSMRAARQTPMYDPVSHLVYVTRGDDVRTTIVNGKVLMRDRKMLTLDENAVLADARAAALRVRAAVTAKPAAAGAR
jgi:5-methylthioadenosine/S-adenosylhomocysteine deaminase